MIKFVEADANEKTGVSTVWLKNGEKEYFGMARLAGGDDWSHIFGCSIAEIRATIKIINDILKDKRKDLKAIENFVKALKCYKNFDENSSTAACVYRQLNRKKIEIERLKQRKAELKKYLADSIEMRSNIKAKISNMKSSKNKDKES